MKVLTAAIGFACWVASSIAPPARAATFEVDTSFGTNGLAVAPNSIAARLPYPAPPYRSNVLVVPEGRILVASPVDTVAGSAVVSAFTLDGKLDATFGIGGIATAGVAGDRFFGAVARQPDGKLIVAGVRQISAISWWSIFCRITERGFTDPSFGIGGYVPVTDPLGNTFLPDNLRVRTDGVIVAAGQRGFKAFFNPAALALTSQGPPDARFGGGAWVAVPSGGFQVSQDIGQIALQPDDKLVSAMMWGDISVSRIDANGTPDPSFGQNGLFTSYMFDGIGAMLLRPDGRLVVSARFGRLIGLTAGGQLDASFGSAGIATVNLPGGGSAYIAAMASLPDGRILVVGNSSEAFILGSCPPAGTANTPFIAIVNSNGTFDSADTVVLPSLLTADTLSANGVGRWIVGGIAAYDAATCEKRFGVLGVRELGRSAAVEFHNPGMDHYFISADPSEIADLDNGVHPGWSRTGLSIPVSIQIGSGTGGVCRFYIPPEHGDSHFFSASPVECAAVLQKIGTDQNYSGYVYETGAAFFMALPDTTSGICANGYVPVYRMWNRRADSNHRYTTDPGVRDAMVAKGYVSEGYGTPGTAMCAPTM